jgi:hypothetical protein
LSGSAPGPPITTHYQRIHGLCKHPVSHATPTERELTPGLA